MGGNVCAAYSIFKDEAGGLLVAGVASDKRETFHSCVWRLGASGAPDPGFGAGGQVCSSGEEWAWAAVPGADGRFYSAGINGRDWKRSRSAFLRCYTREGLPCPGFGEEGLVLLHPPRRGYAAVFAAAFTGSSVFAAGAVTDSGGVTRPGIWEVDLSGKPSSKFLKGGFFSPETPPGSRDSRINALAAGPGFLLAGGNLDWREAAHWKFLPGGPGGELVRGPAGTIRTLYVRGKDIFAGGFRYGDPAKGHAETGIIFRLPGHEVTELDSLENQELFSVTGAAGGLFAAGYADEGGAVKAAVWGISAGGKLRSGFGRGGVKVFPDELGGRESRIYSLTPYGGGLAAAGFSRRADGVMTLAVWKLQALSGR
ncbi:MAG: hypothetical protein A2049_10315 [Elusimicrobia bacterium GWA2_62_23]|nr:MAG: hypothetical protein A2049_10315 [Elusimicrobia bacterium GWA2_62_23]